MKNICAALAAAAVFCLSSTSLFAAAPIFPNQKSGQWTAESFTFHTGETLNNVKIGYTTFGNPEGEPVLVLHGTNGSAKSMITQDFAGELFGAGQPLDAAKYFVILTDAIGAGKSSKPSDGLRTNFPRYNYDDMVLGQYRFVTEGLGIKHLRLIIGNSMGGMQTWLWGMKYPDFMDAIVPMASLPIPMSGRNWMTRRMIIDVITSDPAWQGGNYTEQPQSARIINAFFGLATNGGTKRLQSLAPTNELANQYVDKKVAAPFSQDANDTIYQWASSADYNPANLEAILASVFVINAEDDERNSPALGVMEAAMKRIKNGRYYLIPASEKTSGHGTTKQAKWYKDQLADFIASVPHR